MTWTVGLKSMRGMDFGLSRTLITDECNRSLDARVYAPFVLRFQQ